MLRDIRNDRQAGGYARTLFGDQRRLEDLQRLIDWSKFEHFFRWLNPRQEETGGHSALVLFRAMLLQQWYALIAAEFDRELEDRLSLRRFVGITAEEQPPRHSDVCAFRRLIVDRGVSSEVFFELRRQLTEARGKGTSDDLVDVSDLYFGLAGDHRLFRPPLWVSLEAQFIGFWRQLPQVDGLPVISAMDADCFSDALRSHGAVVRWLTEDNDFAMEFLGEDVIAGNQGPMPDKKFGLKAKENLQEYGHAGLYGELRNCCRLAVDRGQPVGFSTFYFNAVGKRCGCWTIFAPVRDDNSGDVLLVGVCLVTDVDHEQLLSSRKENEAARFPDENETSLGPDEWTELEENFMKFWHEKRAGRRAPGLRDVRLSELADMEAHLTLIRQVSDGKFKYELVGDAVELANGAALVGSSIEDKAADNKSTHGHAGIQNEFARLLADAAKRIQPVRLSTYFMNAAQERCQIWTVQAPLANDEGQVSSFIGVALIKPLTVN